MSKKKRKNISVKPTFSGYCVANKKALNESDIAIKHKLEFEELRKEYNANPNMPEEKKKEFIKKCETMSNDYIVDKCFDFVEKKFIKARGDRIDIPSENLALFKQYKTANGFRTVIYFSNNEFIKMSEKFVSIYDSESNSLYFVPSSEKGNKVLSYDPTKYMLNIPVKEVGDRDLTSLSGKYFILSKHIHSITNKTVFSISLNHPEDELVSVMRELKEHK